MKKISLLLILLSCLWGALEAQAIVNIENMRTIKPVEGWSGQAELSFGGSSGNTDKTSGTTGARLQWVKKAITNFAILRYAYGESAGKRDTNTSFFHARHIHQRTSWRADEYYLQGETNEFSRLSFRGLIGLGQRFTLSEVPKRHAVYFNLGAFYVVEKLDDQFGVTDDGTTRFWRLSTALSYKLQMNEQVHFLSTTYYQPRFDRGTDYRILEEATLAVKMSERFLLKLSLDIVHDSKPPQSVQKTDVVYSTGLEYYF